jgi:glycosyltransferase involved in cell wall biosynthesis
MGAQAETVRAVLESKCGVRVDQDNARALADELKHLSQSESLVRKMGDNARQAFHERYTIEYVVSRYHELLTEVVKPRVGSEEGRQKPVADGVVGQTN